MSVDQEIEYRDPLTKAPLVDNGAKLRCSVSGRSYPIVGKIPRFVPQVNYADNFGDQWNVFHRTQLDRNTETSISRDRLFSGTEWAPEELAGASVLEVGCGAGRFTAEFLKLGTKVWSVDYSNAVEACYKNNMPHENLHLAQADVYNLPFSAGLFDYVFMYGVVQHTPDPQKTIKAIIDMTKPGGRAAFDSYVSCVNNRWTSKYKWRWLTTIIPPRLLRGIVAWYIPKWIKVDDWLGRHSKQIQQYVATWIPCYNYRGIYKLDDKALVEWAILDTYDALGAYYDKPFSRVDLAKFLSGVPGISYSIKRGGIGLEVSIAKAV